jgi:hypothetical protein
MLVSFLDDDREEKEEGALLLSLPLLFSLESELLLELVQPFKKLESKSGFQPLKSIASVVIAARCFVLESGCLDPCCSDDYYYSLFSLFGAIEHISRVKRKRGL